MYSNSDINSPYMCLSARKCPPPDETKVVVFQASQGPATFKVPKGVQSLNLLLVGGGGKGADASDTLGSTGGGGGGGGAIFIKNKISVIPGSVIVVTPGAGGVATSPAGAPTRVNIGQAVYATGHVAPAVKATPGSPQGPALGSPTLYLAGGRGGTGKENGSSGGTGGGGGGAGGGSTTGGDGGDGGNDSGSTLPTCGKDGGGGGGGSGGSLRFQGGAGGGGTYIFKALSQALGGCATATQTYGGGSATGGETGGNNATDSPDGLPGGKYGAGGGGGTFTATGLGSGGNGGDGLVVISYGPGSAFPREN